MSTINGGNEHGAIRETLLRRSGSAASPDAIAKSALDTWAQMAALLEPVIGARGVDALFARSLHLVGKKHQWLGSSGVRGNGAASLAHIRASFESRDSSVSMDAACELLTTFNGLLTNLIGESLTTRLLATVWLPSPSETQKEPPP